MNIIDYIFNETEIIEDIENIMLIDFDSDKILELFKNILNNKINNCSVSIDEFERNWFYTYEKLNITTEYFNYINKNNFKSIFEDVWFNFLENNHISLFDIFFNNLQNNIFININFIRIIEEFMPKIYTNFINLLLNNRINYYTKNINYETNNLKDYVSQFKTSLATETKIYNIYGIKHNNNKIYRNLLNIYFNHDIFKILINKELLSKNYTNIYKINLICNNLFVSNTIYNELITYFMSKFKSNDKITIIVKKYLEILTIINNYFIKQERYQSDCCEADKIKQLFLNMFKNLIEKYDILDKYLLNYINKNTNYKTEVIDLIDYVKDKDIFLLKYKLQLTKNILYNKKITYDKIIIDKLNALNIIDVSRLNIMLKDYNNSNIINNEIQQIDSKYNTSLVYASNGIWPLKNIDNTDNIPSCFSKQQNIITTFLNSKFENRNIHFNSNYIYGIIEMTLNNKTYEIYANVKIIDILLRFNDCDKISKDISENYDILLHENILIEKENYLYLNLNYSNDNAKLILDNKVIKNNKIQTKKIDIDRQLLLHSIIIKLMKFNKNLDKNILFNKSKSKCKSYFKLNEELFNKELKVLLRQEYISENNEIITYIP